MSVTIRVVLAAAMLNAAAAASQAQSDSSDSKEVETARQTLVGAWNGSIVLDEKSLADLLRKGGLPDDQVAPAVEKAAERLRETELEMEYRNDGTYRAVFQSGDRSDTNAGTWKITAVKDGTITIRTTSTRDDAEATSGNGAKPEEKVETFTLERIDADHFRMKPPQLEKAHIKHFDFNRKKPEPKTS